MNRTQLSRLMLITNFVCSLFYALSYPYIYAEMMKVVDKIYISGEQIISCLGVIVFGILWNEIGDFLYKHYTVTIVLEIIADSIMFTHVLVTGNLKIYFVLNVLIYAIITRNMANGGIRLRAKVHSDEVSREHYDNSCNVMNSAATLAGAGISLWLDVDIKILFCFALIRNIFDNFCYYYIYKKVNQLEADKEE